MQSFILVPLSLLIWSMLSLVSRPSLFCFADESGPMVMLICLVSRKGLIILPSWARMNTWNKSIVLNSCVEETFRELALRIVLHCCMPTLNNSVVDGLYFCSLRCVAGRSQNLEPPLDTGVLV